MMSLSRNSPLAFACQPALKPVGLNANLKIRNLVGDQGEIPEAESTNFRYIRLESKQNGLTRSPFKTDGSGFQDDIRRILRKEYHIQGELLQALEQKTSHAIRLQQQCRGVENGLSNKDVLAIHSLLFDLQDKLVASYPTAAIFKNAESGHHILRMTDADRLLNVAVTGSRNPHDTRQPIEIQIHIDGIGSIPWKQGHQAFECVKNILGKDTRLTTVGRQMIGKIIDHFRSIDVKTRITLTGTSMGGGLANALAAEMDLDSVSFNPMPPGKRMMPHPDKLLVRHAQANGLVLKHIHCVNKGDIVADGLLKRFAGSDTPAGLWLVFPSGVHNGLDIVAPSQKPSFKATGSRRRNVAQMMGDMPRQKKSTGNILAKELQSDGESDGLDERIRKPDLSSSLKSRLAMSKASHQLADMPGPKTRVKITPIPQRPLDPCAVRRQ